MFMKKIFKYLVPSLVTLVLLAIVFWCNDLYPFGVNSIVQVYADYQFIPVLYRIYDFLHGNVSVIYDDIGLGNSIYTSMIIQGSIFSPITWLVYFVKRSEIINFINGVSDYIVINEYGNGYNVLVNNMGSDKSLFLPINNILGLKVYNNGKLVDTDKYLDNFLSIKLSYGENDIIIKYELQLFKLGLFFSILGIVMLFIYKNMGIKLDILSNIVYYIYMIVVLVFYLYIYVYSFIK